MPRRLSESRLSRKSSRCLCGGSDNRVRGYGGGLLLTLSRGHGTGSLGRYSGERSCIARGRRLRAAHQPRHSCLWLLCRSGLPYAGELSPLWAQHPEEGDQGDGKQSAAKRQRDREPERQGMF